MQISKLVDFAGFSFGGFVKMAKKREKRNLLPGKVCTNKVIAATAKGKLKTHSMKCYSPVFWYTNQLVPQRKPFITKNRFHAFLL